MTYREGIENMKKEWVGKKVRFRGEMYTVVDVDYNGSLMIDLPNQYNQTTAVSIGMIERIGWENGGKKDE